MSDIKIRCAYTKTEDIASLVPNPRNPNKHGDKQVALLAKIIRHQGWRAPIVVSKRSGFVVSGHGRLEAAKLLQVGSVPVDYQDFETEADEYAHLVADNRIAELAEIDEKELAEILSELKAQDLDMDLTGFDESELAGALDAISSDSDVDAEPQTDKAEELRENWGVVRGQIWGLGEHRLMCGDSGSESDVDRVVGGGLCDMMITDPPYGVAYVGKTKDALTIESDDVNEQELSALVKRWFDCAETATRGGAYWIATVPAGPLHGVFFFDWKTRGILRQVMVWVKDSMVLGYSEYHYRHEPILFGWRPGDRTKNTDRTKTTVWEYDRPKASREHPTMKPVEMWCYGISNHTNPGGLVYEPFSGSGTTIIACERLGRKCRAMEISPAYVAVAIQRWVDATGGTPKLLDHV